MNSGRLMFTLTVLTWKGIPSLAVGSGSETVVTAPVYGSTNNAARRCSSPRSNGPAFVGTTSERPNGAPLYGPVRYARPLVTQNGVGPGPAADATVPIWLSGPQAPWEACGSPHTVTWETAPSRPGGVWVVMPPNIWSWSVLENVTESGL